VQNQNGVQTLRGGTSTGVLSSLLTCPSAIHPRGSVALGVDLRVTAHRLAGPVLLHERKDTGNIKELPRSVV
jgi:hypothetical protein